MYFKIIKTDEREIMLREALNLLKSRKSKRFSGFTQTEVFVNGK